MDFPDLTDMSAQFYVGFNACRTHPVCQFLPRTKTRYAECWRGRSNLKAPTFSEQRRSSIRCRGSQQKLYSFRMGRHGTKFELSAAQQFAEGLKQRLGGHSIDIGPVRIAVSTSVGAAVHPDDGADPEALRAHADQDMYRVKQDGCAAVGAGANGQGAAGGAAKDQHSRHQAAHPPGCWSKATA